MSDKYRPGSVVERLAAHRASPYSSQNPQEQSRARYWLNAIADEAPFGEIKDWLRAKAEEGA